MTTMQRDPLVDDYLRRLRTAASALPRDRRDELVAEIEEHIEAALEGGARDEIAVRNVLERLGEPEEIVAAAESASPRPPRGRLELAALVVLALSFALPVVGYLLGAGLVIASGAWTGREKLLGLAIPPLIAVAGGGLIVSVASNAAEGDSFSSGLGPLEVTVLFANVIAGLLAAAYLAQQLKRPAS
jgi:hypothetical protein